MKKETNLSVPPVGESSGQLMEMMLCEQDFVILKPDQPYIFRYDKSCPSCRKIAVQLGIEKE